MASKDKGAAAQDRGAGSSGPVSAAEKALVRDLRQAAAPDVNKPFADVKDACQRLLPFHVFSDHEPAYALGYSRAVARAGLLLASVPPGPTTSSSSSVLGLSPAQLRVLAEDPAWADFSKEDAGITDDVIMRKVQRHEEFEQQRDAKLEALKKQVQSVQLACEKALQGRETGRLRGEEAALLATWQLQDEKAQLEVLQRREAQRLQLQREREVREEALREAQQKSAAALREARLRTSLESASIAAAAAASQKEQQQQRQAGRGSDQGQWLGLGSPAVAKSSTPTAPRQKPQGGSGSSGDREEEEEVVATDLLAQFAGVQQAVGGPHQPEPAVGGLQKPPMSQDDLLAWTAEVAEQKDVGVDWLGAPGIMDLNLDLPLAGQDNFFGQEGAGTPRGSRQGP